MKKKILILNGIAESDGHVREIVRQITSICDNNKISHNAINVWEKKTNFCTGCFTCWEKTPGVCIFKDDMAKILPKIIHSDIIMFVNKITFGGFNTHLKRVWDRCIPLLSPQIMLIHGECHHAKRYEKYPSIIVYNVLDPEISAEELTLFQTLLDRVAINFHTPFYRTCNIQPGKLQSALIKHPIDEYLAQGGV